MAPTPSTPVPRNAGTSPRRAPRASGNRGLHGTLWVLAYVLLAAFPLVVLLTGPVPHGGGFWWDFSMALGFGGLAVMGLQFALTARFRRATAPFGIDIIYYFHRWAAVSGLGFIVAHYLILRVLYGATLGPANPLDAPGHLTAGRISLALFVALIVTSLWRKQLRTGYDAWRIAHAVMAVTAVVLAIVHVHGVGHYTGAPWKAAVWLTYSGIWLLVVAYIRILRPASLLREPYRVLEVSPERGASWTVTLAPERGERLAFRPGQFAWLTLGANPFRAREHPFSFAGSADEPDHLRFTIKELGDFTRTIKDVAVGTMAYVDGPHGVFTTDYHERAPGFVFVAGGVGIAPIMSMLRTLADRGEQRPLHLIYGSWQWDAVLFREAIDALNTRLNLQVVHVLQEAPEGWNGPLGFITEQVLRNALPTEALTFTCFLCGPKAMTDFVQPSLRRMGFPLKRIHTELFEMA